MEVCAKPLIGIAIRECLQRCHSLLIYPGSLTSGDILFICGGYSVQSLSDREKLCHGNDRIMKIPYCQRFSNAVRKEVQRNCVNT